MLGIETLLGKTIPNYVNYVLEIVTKKSLDKSIAHTVESIKSTVQSLYEKINFLKADNFKPFVDATTEYDSLIESIF